MSLKALALSIPSTNTEDTHKWTIIVLKNAHDRKVWCHLQVHRLTWLLHFHRITCMLLLSLLYLASLLAFLCPLSYFWPLPKSSYLLCQPCLVLPLSPALSGSPVALLLRQLQYDIDLPPPPSKPLLIERHIRGMTRIRWTDLGLSVTAGGTLQPSLLFAADAASFCVK